MKQVTLYRVILTRESNKRYEVDTTFNSSQKAARTLKEVLKIEEWHNERFGIAALNVQNKLIGLHIISEGTVNETAVYTREIATRALLNNASNVIIFHNHPGESLNPSNADIATTKNIKTALDTLNIKLIDHIILTETENYTSFAEKGLL